MKRKTILLVLSYMLFVFLLSACQATHPTNNITVIETTPTVIIHSDLETVGDYIFAIEAVKAGAIIK